MLSQCIIAEGTCFGPYSCSLPAEVLLEVQELCIPIASNPEALPLVRYLMAFSLVSQFSQQYGGGLRKIHTQAYTQNG